MPQGVEDPLHKQRFGEALAAKADSVEVRVLQVLLLFLRGQVLTHVAHLDALVFDEQLLLELLLVGVGLHSPVALLFEVEAGVPHNWQRRHRHVIQLVNELFVQRLPGEGGEESKVELRGHIQEILVEGIQYHVRISSIRLTTVEEKQRLQELELANGVVCASCSLLALLAQDADADVGLQDHSNVVGAVTDGQSSFCGMPFLHHVDDVGLLLRGNAAGEDDVDLFAHVKEYFLGLFKLIDNANRLPRNHERLPLKRDTLLRERLIDTLMQKLTGKVTKSRSQLGHQLLLVD